MKRGFLIVIAAITIISTGCKVKNGCPSNGRNVGAEKLLSGDKKSMKEVKKAGKFKMGKIPNYK